MTIIMRVVTRYIRTNPESKHLHNEHYKSKAVENGERNKNRPARRTGLV